MNAHWNTKSDSALRRGGAWAVALCFLLAGVALAQQYAPQRGPGQSAQPPSGTAEPAPGAMDAPQLRTPRTGSTTQPGTTKQGTPGGMTEGDAPLSARAAQMEADAVPLTALDSGQIEDLQRTLQEAAYYTAQLDGIAGSKTRQALRQFYSDQARLAARGMITPEGAVALGLDASDIEAAREDAADEDRPAREPEGAGRDQSDDASPPTSQRKEADPSHERML